MFRVLFFFLITFSVASYSQTQWPPITNTTKPWTRWWWQGSAVNKTDLTWNLEQYRKAGLGGVEITPIYGIHGYEKEFIGFLSPKWMEMLMYTLSESKRMGLGVDLANATGWPFGGPWVSDKDASKSVYFKTYSVNAGEQLNQQVEYNREAWVRTANNKPASVDTLVKPVGANKNLQGLALDQIQYPGKLPLSALMAYSGTTVLDLTSKVDANGKLNWTAPAGTWTLYALFEGLHGKMVERAAPGGEGYAIDHFSLDAANNYFKKFDEAFKGYDLSYLRAFFNDSYEVDDARGQANWTSDMFEEFKKRRGYDLKEHLPALFGKDDSLKNKRVLYDYRSVIDELILEHFTMIWKKWGTSKGALVRNQSHGSPANTLDLYSVVDIPETEGTDVLRFKFATSAANVTGKKLVSSESATWLNEHFLSSWADVKKAIDLYFLGGVNHIFYHGTEYSPKNAPWPGWLFYAAVHFQPTNPQWKDFHILNEYITRVQAFLQRGKPDNDVLLYYPIADRYSEPGTALLQHFDGMERNFEHTDFEHVSKWMVEKGYSFDFFSDRQLAKFTNDGTGILSGGNNYKTILLPANKFIPEASFEKLVNLAKAGAIILVYKELPGDVPGLGQLDQRTQLFDQLKKQLKFVPTGPLQKAAVGKGAFFISDNLTALMQAGNAWPEGLIEQRLSFIRRKDGADRIYFITNRTDTVFRDWIAPYYHGASAVLYDPMTGKAGLARTKNEPQIKGTLRVFIELQPYESVIVRISPGRKTGTKFLYTSQTGPRRTIATDWTLKFLEGGPSLPSPSTIRFPEMRSWTELTATSGEDVKNFSGTVSYATNFNFVAHGQQADAWILDLGKVHETAEVFLNDKKIATLIGPVYRVTIPAASLRASNKLEIRVSNLMANRIAYMDRNNLPWKIFYNTNMPARRRENVKNGLFDASDWKPLPSGLLSPVTLIPVKYE
jgi:hypothetical protein